MSLRGDAVAVQLLRLVDEPLRLGEVAGRLEHPHRLARAGSVRRFLPRRRELREISSLAASRMLPNER
jgi:hypothetical protein